MDNGKERVEVYGGIGYKPSHPNSDMHGLIRVVVMAKGRHKALSILKREGIRQTAFLRPTLSIVEHQAAILNRVVVADIRLMYLKPTDYREFKEKR